MGSYSNAKLTHYGTISAEGTTSGADEEVAAATDTDIISVKIYNKGATDFHVKLNGETNSHLVPSGLPWSSGLMGISSVVIVESGSEYALSGGRSE